MRSILISTLLAVSASFAWDGQRQGFILGTGAGVSSYSFNNSSAESGELESISSVAPMMVGRLGYAPSNTTAYQLYSLNYPWGLGYSGVNMESWSSEAVGANSWFGGLGLLSGTQDYIYADKDVEDPDLGFGVNAGYSLNIASHASLEVGMLVGVLNDKITVFQADENTLFVGVHFAATLTGY